MSHSKYGNGRVNNPQGPCDHCKLENTVEGHDGCLGTLPEWEVMNACCGHGSPEEAYVQFWNAPRISGEEALFYFQTLSKGPPR